MEPPHQLATGPRRHCTTADAVRDHIDRGRSVERTMRILVDGATPTAIGRDRDLELARAYGKHSVLRDD